jgi:hypothetical protein
MMTSEEIRVLTFLRQHGAASVATLAGACLSNLPADWVNRVVANLDWLGYVSVYGDGGGADTVLQITEKGRAHFGGPHRALPATSARRST